MWLHILSSPIWCVNSALCGVSESYTAQCTVHTPNITGYTSYTVCSHITEISLNDVFQLIILMIITLVKHKLPRSLMMFVEN